MKRVVRPESVVVLGGAGGVGEGIVEALLAHGSFANVIVVTRDEAKRDSLVERHRIEGNGRRLSVILGSVDDHASAEAAYAEALSHGPILAVVASLGGWWDGPKLTDVDEATWDNQLRELLRPHFIAARTFVPKLESRGSRYLVVGGGAARSPVPGSTLVSIAGAAQLMLVRALVAERTDELWPTIEELIIDGPVETRGRHHGPVRAGEITAREVGDVVADMLHDGTTGTWPNVTREGPIITICSKRIASGSTSKLNDANETPEDI